MSFLTVGCSLSFDSYPQFVPVAKRMGLFWGSACIEFISPSSGREGR
jgi:hypothetical protein